VLADARVIGVLRKQPDPGLDLGSLRHHEVVIGIEHGNAIRTCSSHNRAFHPGESLQFSDAVQSNMVGTHVEKDPDIARFVAQSSQQYPTPGSLQHANLN
jgi:hypothetical protein